MLGTSELIHKENRFPPQNALHPTVERPAAPAVTARYGNVLALPHFSPNVPASFTVGGDPEESCIATLAFVDAGLVAERDIPERWESNDSIIKSALERRFASCKGKLDLFDMHVICADDLEYLVNTELNNLDELVGSCGSDPEQKTINFVVYSGEWSEVFIGRKVEELETACPGFGKMVMHTVSRAANSTMYCVTPNEALGLCSGLYWYGENDESVVLEEEGEDADVISRDDLFNNMPEWSTEYGEGLPDTKKVAKLCRHKNPLVAEVASALLSLIQKLSADIPHHAGICFAHVSPAAVIRWNQNDMVMQIYDDQYRYLNESGEYNEAHSYFIVNQEPGLLLQALDSIDQYIDLVAAFDKLLLLLREDVCR